MRYHPGNAGYEVFFTGDVSNGAFGATIGRPGITTRGDNRGAALLPGRESMDPIR
jgi:hypothetical protein